MCLLSAGVCVGVEEGEAVSCVCEGSAPCEERASVEEAMAAGALAAAAGAGAAAVAGGVVAGRMGATRPAHEHGAAAGAARKAKSSQNAVMAWPCQ